MSTLTRLLLLIALSAILIWSNRTFADDGGAAAHGSRRHADTRDFAPLGDE